MAKQIYRDTARRRPRPWWRLVLGGFVGAIIGFCFLRVRRLQLERNDQAADQPAMAHATSTAHIEGPKTAFEPTDWELAPVALVYVGVLLLLGISCLALVIAYPGSLPDVSRRLDIQPPGPRLQTDPEADLARFRADEDKRLNGYYWVDKQKGIVHVPIDQAMRKLVQTGIPGFPKAQP